MRVMRPARLAFSALAVSLALLSCKPHESAEPNIQLNDGWARATAPGQTTGGVFLTIRNTGQPDDRLTGGSSAVAESVEIHESRMDGDVMRMRRLDEVVIPANGSVTLGPGSAHIMLVGLKHPLVPGDRLPLTLTFAKSGARPTSVLVGTAGSTAPRRGEND